MPRSRALQIGRKTYQRRQPPVRYLATGGIRPCWICKMAERPDGGVLYSQVGTIRTHKAERTAPGRWDPIMERTPDGEIVPRVFEVKTAVNYHPLCEAENQRRLARLRPKVRDKMRRMEEELERQKELIEDLQARLGGRKAQTNSAPIEQPPSQPGFSNNTGNGARRVTGGGSPARDLDDMARMSPAFAGSGRTVKRWPVGSIQELIVSSSEGKDPNKMRKMLETLDEFDKAGSANDPDSAKVSSDNSTSGGARKKWMGAPLGYDPSEPLGE
jgi:hypothetical protein